MLTCMSWAGEIVGPDTCSTVGEVITKVLVYLGITPGAWTPLVGPMEKGLTSKTLFTLGQSRHTDTH